MIHTRHTQTRLTAHVIAVMLTVTALGAADWPGFRGPNGNGWVPTDEAPATGLQIRWKQPIGSSYSGIAVSGEVLVTCAAQGEEDVLLGLSTRDGSTLWSVALGAAYKGHGGSLDGAISSPAIADGTAYVLGPRGRMVAVEVETGELRWQRDLSDLNTDPPYYGLVSSPLVVDDLVLVQVGGGGGVVTALERDSGEIAWRAFEGDVYAQSPKVATIDGRRQVLFAANEWVGGLDPEEGTLLWRWPHQGRSATTLSTSPLVLEDGTVFFTPSDDRAVLLRPPALAAQTSGEAPEAEVVWEGNLLNKTYSPATVVGDLLVGYTSRFLGAFSAATGERLWRTRSPGDGFAVAVGEQLITITKDGDLHIGDVAPEGYTEVASTSLFDEVVWTTPSIAGDTVYVRSMTELARVDLQRAERGLRTTGASDDRPLPAILEEILKGDTATLSARIDAFWRDVETPILDDGKALFLWRGDAQDVGIAGEFFGARREEPLRRLEGTDLWWIEAPVEPRLVYGYFFFVDYEPTLDPKNPRTDFQGVWGYSVNWIRGDEPVEVSVFATQGAAAPPAHHRPGYEPAVEGALVELTVTPPEGADERLTRSLEAPLEVWLPPGYDQRGDRRYPVVYFLRWDFSTHPKAGRWLETLNATAGRDYEAPIVVMLDRPLPLPVVVEAADAAFATRAEREQRAVISMAFAGNAALAAVLRHSDLFGKFGLQSLFQFAGEDVERLEALITEDVASTLVGYFEWGSLDLHATTEGWDMREVSRGIYEVLVERGARVGPGEVDGTTDWKSWRNRTHEMLAALFPLPADSR